MLLDFADAVDAATDDRASIWRRPSIPQSVRAMITLARSPPPRRGGLSPRSKVAVDIEDAGQGVVKLTVVHDGFEPGSDVLEGISNGWSAVLSSLTTLLETGSALP